MAESESRGKTPLWLNLVINYTSPDFACCNYFVASARRTINSLCFLPLRLFSLSLSLCSKVMQYCRPLWSERGRTDGRSAHTNISWRESRKHTNTHTHMQIRTHCVPHTKYFHIFLLFKCNNLPTFCMRDLNPVGFVVCVCIIKNEKTQAGIYGAQ